MALIEEVWGSLTPEPAPTKPVPKPDTASTPTPPEPDIAQEPFQSPPTTSTQSPPHKNLTLFLAVLITGICSIYAVDMFAETIRNS